jgi:hypothetical protein
MALHYPFVKPYKTIMVFYGIIIPSKQNTTLLAFIPLFAISGTPFYAVVRPAGPAPFLEAIS